MPLPVLPRLRTTPGWPALWLVCALLAPVTRAEILFRDEFDELAQWQDLSTAVTWGGGGSAFELENGTVRLSSFGGDVGNYTSVSGLKTFSALDLRFAAPITHSTQTVIISLRARWTALRNASAGEGNRLNVSFVHDYPVGGLDLATNARYDDFSRAWWGRPAYQVRIRGGDSANARAILQYGGGLDIAGEWEIYKVNSVPQWWLPGFNSAPGGGSPGNTGQGWVLTDTGLASTNWQTIDYIVSPETQRIIVDGVARGVQNIAVNDGNPYFHVFDQLSGLRLYWRGADANTEIDWLVVSLLAAPETQFAIVNLDGADYPALRYRRPAGGTGIPGVNYTVHGMVYTVEISGQPGPDWNSGADWVELFSEPVAHTDGTETVTIRTRTPLNTAAAQFLRLKVSAL